MYAFSFLNNKIIKNTIKKITVVFFVVILFICSIFCIAKITLKKTYPIKYESKITELSNLYGLEKTLIYAVINVESGFDESVISGAGAVGLMQITPSTANYVAKMKGAKEFDLLEPSVNLDFGCYYLKYLIVKFKDTNLALCAYNAGEGNVFSWLKNKEYSSDGKTLVKIPFKETREYIKKISFNQAMYRKIYKAN